MSVNKKPKTICLRDGVSLEGITVNANDLKKQSRIIAEILDTDNWRRYPKLSEKEWRLLDGLWNFLETILDGVEK